MFLDAGAEEIMVVAVAALIFVGPKDLPVVLRKVGQFTARMRGLAAEFRASFDEMARQSELDELKREVEALRRGDPIQPVRAEVDSHFEALHRELGAPPPSGFGAREGEIVPTPETSAMTGPQPVSLSQAPGTVVPSPAGPTPTLPPRGREVQEPEAGPESTALAAPRPAQEPAG